MRSIRTNTKAFFTLALMFILGISALEAQTYTLDNAQSDLTVFGTSNIHDWEITVEQQKGSITLEEGENMTLKAMKVSIPVTSLKSGKSGMDKNTYKAMHADDYATIVFTANQPATLSPAGTDTFKAQVKGDLTISGVTKAATLDLTFQRSASGWKLSGEKTLDMTTFNIEPPKALMGTITTGKEVTLKFNTILK